MEGHENWSNQRAKRLRTVLSEVRLNYHFAKTPNK